VIKTDVPNYFRGRPGVVLHHNEEEKQRYLAQKRMLSEKEQMKQQINILNDEVRELKELVNKLINKE
jgi:hypothetical protein